MRPTPDGVPRPAPTRDAHEHSPGSRPCHLDAGTPGSGFDNGLDNDTVEPTVTYAVLTSAGQLRMRTVDNRISVDEWDTPYQGSLWAAVHDDVDPHRREVNGVALDGNMRAKIADAAEHRPEQHPPNPVASAVLTTLGCAPRRWAGTIAIVGHEDDNGITASLTSEQRKAITQAHRLAVTTQRQTA